MTVAVVGDDTGYFVGVVDASIDQGAPTTNTGTDYIFVSSNGTNKIRALMQFSGLASIVGPVTVSSAVLTLTTADTNAARAVSLRQLLVPFDEASATWNIRSTGNDWGTAGASGAGDAGTTVLASGTIPATNGATFDITDVGGGFNSLVQGWINGTITNNGCIISLTDEATASYYYLLRQSEDPTASRRPYLTVTYTAGTASNAPIVSTTRKASRNTFGIRR